MSRFLSLYIYGDKTTKFDNMDFEQKKVFLMCVCVCRFVVVRNIFNGKKSMINWSLIEKIII